MSDIGLLAFGSLIRDPGVEIEPLITRRIAVRTPFPVEYARFSTTRGGAPTLVPHDSGSSVSAELLVLRGDVSLKQAKDLMWRRETRQEGTGKTYPAGTSPNSIVVRELREFQGLDHILYTDFHSAGKVERPDLAVLIQKATASVKRAELGRDGISYLLDALNQRIQTPLTEQYVSGIRRATGATSLSKLWDGFRPADFLGTCNPLSAANGPYQRIVMGR